MDELRSLLDAVAMLGDKPSRRHRWINWIVWAFAILFIAISILYFGLLASQWLTGWPPN